MTEPTISPSPQPGITQNPAGVPAHGHPYTAITGLRFGPNGRVEPVYDSADVIANNQVIALYNAATAKGSFTRNAVGPVTVSIAVQQVEGSTENTEGKAEADRFLAEGRITKEEHTQITTTPTPAGPGVSAPPSIPTGTTNGANVFGPDAKFTYDTVLTSKGTTLGQMIKNVTFPRTIEQLSNGYPGMKPHTIVNNLAAFAVNIYEPVKAQFPKAFLTNTFRDGAKIGGGQHGTGQAGDFQFRGLHSSGYFDVAVWFSKNLPFDQLLLEYLPGKTVWIHCSYAIEGLPHGGISVGKSKGKASQLATLNGAAGGKFTPGLHADIIEKAGINRVVAG